MTPPLAPEYTDSSDEPNPPASEDVHDPSERSLHHGGQHGPGDAHGPGEVDLDHLRLDRPVGVEERTQLVPAGAAHTDLDLSECLGRAADGPGDRLRIGHVQLDGPPAHLAGHVPASPSDL